VVVVERSFDIYGNTRFSGMAQAGSMQDYNFSSQGKWRVKDSDVAKAPRVFFVPKSMPSFLGKRAQGSVGI
jgi:hypothetical protein